MSEIDDSSAVLELESLAQKILKAKGESLKSRREFPTTEKYQSSTTVQEAPAEIEKPSLPKEPPTVRQPGRKQPLVTKKRPATELKLLQQTLKEQEKRNKEDLKKWMERLTKSHESQINKMRADYLNQSTALRTDVKTLLEGQGKDLKESCAEILSNTNQEELERLTNWFHDEFMKALDDKSREFEELKSSSESQVNKMVEEIEGRTSKIKELDETIIELSRHLSKDVRHELFEELGLQHLENRLNPPEEKKKRHESFLGRLSAMFKRPSKAPSKDQAAAAKAKRTNDLSKKSRKKQVATAEVIAS